MQNLTTTFSVFTVGRKNDIDALSFQDAAQKMLEKHGFTSVASILVDDNQHGAIEFLECEIVSNRLTYQDYDVHNTHDADHETLERLDFYASLKTDSPAPAEQGVQVCASCNAKFGDQDAYQIHLGIGAPAFHRCDTPHEMQVKGMYERRGPVSGVWCIPAQFVTHRQDWAYLNAVELKRYVDAVKKAARLDTEEEPVEITDVFVSGSSPVDIDFDVSWVLIGSAETDLSEVLQYSVQEIDGDLFVEGPEWS